MAVQFNETHFNQSASSTSWIAVFPCPSNSTSGNTSALISHAQKLGAHAILTYSDNPNLISYCNLTDNTPPVTIPIYVTENWAGGNLVFRDELDGLFKPSKIRYYDAAAMNSVAANVTSDLAALRTNFNNATSTAPYLTKTDVILARIGAIAMNTSVVPTTASPKPSSTPKPSSASRRDVPFSAVLIGVVVYLMGNQWR
ncbi:hypothetical protein B0H10DRAFT_660158 [Mycena sp. CBHHK59/15]|nr:hypothetical protein B0H10DRAFT_660158 [Mycena sp. CBHHK59/15]